MPHATTVAEGATTTTGDRLDVGDLITTFTGVAAAAAPTEDCTEESSGVALTMGAASLAVAGTAALALALSI